MYKKRFYRKWAGPKGLRRFEIAIEQSDLLIFCDGNLEKLACGELRRVRRELEDYVLLDPQFLVAFNPRPTLPSAPALVRHMAAAAALWSVGPMAAVAGAIAQAVGRKLLERCGNVIVENGGDVFLRTEKPATFALYAGEESPFSDKILFEVDASSGLGVCTSSGVVGPSVSLGRADAVVAIAADAAQADAAATAIANRVRMPGDVDRVLDDPGFRDRLAGLIACKGDRIGFRGDIKIV
jgi:ApbE superfamily uncharacterized protein (UPF0280 family)